MCVSLQRVQAFMRGACTVNASPGGEFVLLDGNVTGQFIELVSLSFVCDQVLSIVLRIQTVGSAL